MTTPNVKSCEQTKADLNDVIEEIAEIFCEKNNKIAEDYLGSQSDTIEIQSTKNLET